MDKKTVIVLIFFAFLAGLSVNNEVLPDTEMPLSTRNIGITPNDWIEQDKIHVYRSHIKIDLQNAVWANFTDTNSMTPVLSSKSNAIQIKPKYEEDIHIGDIISFRNKITKKRIIHRVIGLGNDSEGDNNPEEDPFKVRFENIERVVVAVIY